MLCLVVKGEGSPGFPLGLGSCSLRLAKLAYGVKPAPARHLSTRKGRQGSCFVLSRLLGVSFCVEREEAWLSFIFVLVP